MTPQHTLVLVYGRRSMIAWKSVCAANVLLAVVAGLMVAMQPFENTGCSRVKTAKMAIKSVEQALVAYQTDNHDECPKAINDLYTGKYLTKAPKDPWGEMLLFQCPGEHNKDGADIVSKGRDRVLGTADDVKSWEL